jgi:hypothetical protein
MYKLKSRKLWFAIGTAILAILNEVLNIGLEEQTIQKIVEVCIGYIIGEGISDIVKKK